jgi:hypothetical protein
MTRAMTHPESSEARENPKEIQYRVIEEGAIVCKICPQCNEPQANPEDKCHKCLIENTIATAILSGILPFAGTWIHK